MRLRSRRQRLSRLVLIALLAFTLVFLLPRVFRAVAGEVVQPVEMVVTVESGDTLWDIAQRLQGGGDPRRLIEQIRRLNGLVTAGLHPGQRLVIPSEALR